MRANRLAVLAAVAAGCCGLPGCAPGPLDYAAIGQTHRQHAADDAAIARQNVEAAEVLGRRGDRQGEAIATAAARENARAAEDEQARADRDAWFSTWWP